MARDIELSQDNDTGEFDIDFENGDFKLTDGLETAFLMSVFYKQRATPSQIQVPERREGHFTDTFNLDENYQVGCLLWLYSDQEKNTDQNRELIEDTIRNDGLQWLIDDNIINDVQVTATKRGDRLVIEAQFVGVDEVNSRSHDAFINTFF